MHANEVLELEDVPMTASPKEVPAPDLWLGPGGGGPSTCCQSVDQRSLRRGSWSLWGRSGAIYFVGRRMGPLARILLIPLAAHVDEGQLLVTIPSDGLVVWGDASD